MNNVDQSRDDIAKRREKNLLMLPASWKREGRREGGREGEREVGRREREEDGVNDHTAMI